VAVPVTAPVLDGEKVTVKTAAPPAARICPAATPLTLKPAPEILTFSIEIGKGPVLVTVTERALLLPVATFPKLTVEGATFTFESPAPPVAPTHPDASTAARRAASNQEGLLRLVRRRSTAPLFPIRWSDMTTQV
jgi:hypothetical protein